MIFITVGNLDPFDRLIQSIDQWAEVQAHPVQILAQIGTGEYQPRNFPYVEFLSPREYLETFEKAGLVVSHAGMGSIITALEKNKPMIIMPKRASLGEQRNEHQLATAKRFHRSNSIQVAYEVEQLHELLTSFSPPEDTTATVHSWPPDASLISFVRDFISAGPERARRTLPGTKPRRLPTWRALSS